MIRIHRREFVAGAAAAGFSFAMPAALAQSAATVKTARFTVGFPPGDMADVVARLITEELRGKYAETLIVDNKAGAAGRLAIGALVHYKADGSEVLFSPGSMVVLFPHVFEKLPYDPMADLKPVANVATSAIALAVGPAVPAEVKTLEQYLAWVRKDPKNLAYATSGAGTSIHFTAEYLAKVSNTPLNMVPYRGGAPAVADLIGGQIPAQFSVVPSLIEHARAGRIRMLAVSSAERLKVLPQVPTFSELGFPQVVTEDFFGFFLPAGAPDSAAQALHRYVSAAAREPKVAAQLENLGLSVTTNASAADFAKYVTGEHRKWGEIAKLINFKPLA